MNKLLFQRFAAVVMILSFALPNAAAFSANEVPAAAPTLDVDAAATVVFEENAGQFPAAVRFLARTAGGSVFVTDSEAVYVLSMPDERPASDDHRSARMPTAAQYALRMRFAVDGRRVTSSGSQPVEQRTNYFLGASPTNWHANVANYRQIILDNIADGISMVWHGRERGAVQYDMVVAPGADPANAALTFEGATSLEIDGSGDLLIHTPAGVVRQARPFTYQDRPDTGRREVASSFRIDGEAVRFDLGDYDRTLPLVIDPTVTLNNAVFSTFVGSFGDEFANDIVVDANGCTYVTGRTTSTTYPTTSGTIDTTANGSEDVFVTKFNPSGTGIVFSTFLGGTFYDEGRSIQVDGVGNIYVAGAASIGFPVTAGAYDTTFNGASDVFAVKLNPTGSSITYGTYIGASGIENAEDMAIDSLGNAYLTGRTGDAVVDYPTTVGAFDETFNGIDDGFLTKLNDTGTALVYSTFLGGTEIDGSYYVEVNAAGEAFVGSFTTDGVTDFPTTAGSYDTTHNGVTDIAVTKVNASGSALIFSTFIGGPGIDNIGGLAFDAAGSVYIAGTVSSGYPTTAGVFDTTLAGSNEIGLSKISSTGASLVYSTYLGGTQGESPNSIAVDRFGVVYVTGSNFGGDYPTTSGAYDTTWNGLGDAIVTVVNPTATALINSTYIGGGGNDTANAIAVDTNGNIYIAGQSVSNATQYPTTNDAYQTFHGGSTDAFVTKLGDLTIGGRVIDTNGNPLANVMVAMSGQVSGTVITGADGRFGFTDTVPGEPHSVTATRPGYLINPSIFNITALASNRELVFVGTPGSPSGGAGGTLLFQQLAYNKSENGSAVTVTVNRTGTVSSSTPVTVDYTTSNGSAVAGDDYQAVNGVLTFAPFETAKTITIPLVNDNVLEPRETLAVTISNPTNNADIEIGRETTTINLLDEDLKDGGLLISEFRERGRLGTSDEYVKLFNPNDFDITINAADGSAGITLARTNDTAITPVVTIPNLVTIRSRGHYLLTNNAPTGGFSLIDFPTGIGTLTSVGDRTFSADIPDNSGLVLLGTADQMQFTPSNVIDAVGFGNSSWTEGRGLPAINAANYEACFVRRLDQNGLQDSGDNLSDFVLLDNRSGSYSGQDGTKTYSALGTPAPETSESLRMMKSSEVSMVEAGPELYDPTPVPNGAAGTLTIYRQITNLTNAPISSIRLRAIEFPTPGSFSQRRTSSRPDFRLLNSTDSAGVLGLTLAGERMQPNGGGLNSTLSVDSVTSTAPIAPGQSIVIAIRFGVMRWGRHPFTAAIEALQ